MKKSRYNLIMYKDAYGYWYNTLSHHYFRISENSSHAIEQFLNTTDDFGKLPDVINKKLILGNFIIDDNVDEIQEIWNSHRKAVDAKNYFLIVLPTLNCNYHCWYCIQEHVESKMNAETMNNLLRHIDYMIDVEKIESFHLDWFGGEPLMYFDDVIKPVSEYAISKCQSVGIPFVNTSTTNGYYLSENYIDECIRLNFKNFQITLDGDMKFHDNVKFCKGCESTFRHVLNNINTILRKSEDIRIILRINYNHKNLSAGIIEEVNEFIEENNRSRIMITPRKVWQEDVDNGYVNTLNDILDNFRKSGYGVQYWNPVMNFIPCYANKKYYNAINYNGNVVKCTACDDLYDNNPKGKLNSNGRIIWNDDFDKHYMSPTFDNKKCLNCNKLPICMGLCPREHVNGRKYCKEDVLDSRFEISLINYIDRQYQ